MKIIHSFWKHRSIKYGVLFILPAILSLLLAQYICQDPYKMDFAYQLSGPSESHLVGTDQVGRDVLSRSLYGSRISLYVATMVSVIAGILGLVIGSFTAYYEKLDLLVMRILDGWMAFPPLLLALLIAATLGSSVRNLILALTVVYTPRIVRVVRGSVIDLKTKTFIQAARASGASDVRILLKHIIPNSLAPLIVQMTITFAAAILTEASISFVGVGVPAPTPSWGNILSDARSYFEQAPWLMFPGFMIILSVLGFNLIGDGLRDVLDPKMKQ